MINKRTGIQIDDSGDIVVSSGSVSIGDTLAQNEFILILAQPGELKEHPRIGAGLADAVGGTDTAVIKRKIRDTLAEDGMKVSALEIKASGEITRLEADYV